MQAVIGRWRQVLGTLGVGGAALACVGVVMATASSDMPGPVEPTEGSAQAQARADEVFEGFNGTQYQRNASGVVQAWSLNGAMDTCMAGHGHPEWDWSALRNAAPRTNALDTSVWFKNPQGRSYSNAMLDIAPAIRAEQDARTLPAPASQAKAIDDCLDDVEASSDDAAQIASTPEAVATLRNEWWAMLSTVDAKYGDEAAYRECFAQVPDSEAASGETWQSALQQRLPSAGKIPGGEVEPTPEWVVFLELEATWEEADWRCRGEVYNEHIGDVLDAIEEFADTHADQIREAQQGWAEVVARAEELGFTGQDGSLEDVARG